MHFNETAELQWGSRLDTPAIIDLLCAAVGSVDGGDLELKLAHLSPGGWNSLLFQAERHGLAPLLDYSVRSACPGFRIFPDAARRLKRAVHIGAGRNMRLFEELSRMLGALRSEGIPVIALKGVHLASTVYERIEHRQMQDVDLLVPVPDLQRTADVFEGLGYASMEAFRVEQVRTRSQHLPTFTRSGAVPVEIHWDLERPTSPFTVDLEGLWQRALPEKLVGVDIQVLAPEDLLLHTCLHAAYHHRFVVSLKVFTDIDRILRRYGQDLDWEGLAVRAVQWSASRPLHLCLLLARELMGAMVPEDALRSLEPSDFDPGLTDAAREQVQVYSEDQPFVPWLSRKHARLWGLEWPWGSPSFWFGRLFLSRRTLARKYPSANDSRRPLLRNPARIVFSYPRRALDLFLGIGRGGWRMLRGRRDRKAAAGRENLLGEYLTRT